jgi:hypothetical protein
MKKETPRASQVEKLRQIAKELAYRAIEISNKYCDAEQGMDGWSMHDLVGSIAGGAAAAAEIDVLEETPGKHDEEISERMRLMNLYLELLERNAEARQQELQSEKRGNEQAWLAALKAREQGLSHHTEYIKAVLKQFNYL